MSGAKWYKRSTLHSTDGGTWVSTQPGDKPLKCPNTQYLPRCTENHATVYLPITHDSAGESPAKVSKGGSRCQDREEGWTPLGSWLWRLTKGAPTKKNKKQMCASPQLSHPIHSAFSVHFSLSSLWESLSTLEVTQLPFPQHILQ